MSPPVIQRYIFPSWMGVLLFLALIVSSMNGNSSRAYAASTDERLTYYGVDLQKMAQATGVHPELPRMIAPDAPWPQNTGNYCFIAVVQAIVNYNDLMHGLAMRYPTQNDEGPNSDNPDDERPGQILYDMDHLLLPPGGPLPVIHSGMYRRPYTRANIAYDFGGDPRSQSVAISYEMFNDGFSYRDARYHQHIYHNGSQAATMGIARALAQYAKPVIALVNHGEHSVLVTGVWMTGNPLFDPHAQIRKLDVFNPWNQAWGTYLSTGYFAQITYNDWINATHLPNKWGGTTTWFNLPYQSNGTLDPDAEIGLYQVGPGTLHPHAHHWIGNYVFIQYDGFPISADFTFDENSQLMLKP